MADYTAPAAYPVSASWQVHKDRNPPSSEPGTDYGTPYGTPVVAAAAGVVVDVNWSPSGGTGRYLTVALDDGNTVRYLHLSEPWLGVGTPVSAGDVIGLSGASGYGQDWYYGPHVHTTLWQGPAWVAPTVDFETFIGTTQPTGNEIMPLRIISGPSYQSADPPQWVMHNGHAAVPITQVERAALLPSGIPWCDYTEEDAFQAELRLVWTLGTSAAENIAGQTWDEFVDRLHLDLP